MAAPTFVASYGNAATSTTTPKTASVTVAVGDLLVVYAGTGGPSTTITAGPTGGSGFTWTQQTSIVGVTGYSCQYIWTATATSAQTFTMSLATTGTGAGSWSFTCLRFSSHGGVGASTAANATAAAPTLNITTTKDSSAVVVADADFTATDGASRAWRTGAGTLTEVTYTTAASAVTLYGGYHANAGTAGVKAVGLTAPSQTYSIAAVEVLGTSSPLASVRTVQRVASFRSANF